MKVRYFWTQWLPMAQTMSLFLKGTREKSIAETAAGFFFVSRSIFAWGVSCHWLYVLSWQSRHLSDPTYPLAPGPNAKTELAATHKTAIGMSRIVRQPRIGSSLLEEGPDQVRDAL